MQDLWLRACRYTPFIKLYMTVLQTCMLRRRTRSNLGYFTDTCLMKSAGMAHIATLVFIIQLHLLYIYGTENVRNVEKHYAMFTES